MATIQVDADAYEVMEKLLKMDSQGFVRWIDFERAMIVVGFSVSTGSGSRVVFKSDIWGPITIHRPHHSKIEHLGCKHIGRDLRYAYGWETGMFETL